MSCSSGGFTPLTKLCISSEVGVFGCYSDAFSMVLGESMIGGLETIRRLETMMFSHALFHYGASCFGCVFASIFHLQIPAEQTC